MRQQIFLDGSALHLFPCGSNKKPTTAHGFKDTAADAPAIARLWRDRWGPLIGVRTGEINKLSVIDVDPRRGGDRWYELNRNRLPVTRVHATPSRGLHLLYRYAPALPNSVDRIAPGIESLNNNRYFIWWPAAGYQILADAPLAEFPAWLTTALKGGMGVSLSPRGEQVGLAAGGFKNTPISPSRGAASRYQINYANKALRNAGQELGRCDEGRRNHLLNVFSYKMGRLVANGWISRGQVENYLIRCCETNGLIDDGEQQCRATLASGINAGMAKPYHDVCER